MDILLKMVKLANSLDNIGFYKEADIIDKIAQNITTDDYGGRDTGIGSAYRTPLPGSEGGEPANAAMPDKRKTEPREEFRRYMIFPMALNIVSKDLPIQGADGIHIVPGVVQSMGINSNVVTMEL